jgi:hypothetical protein
MHATMYTLYTHTTVRRTINPMGLYDWLYHGNGAANRRNHPIVSETEISSATLRSSSHDVLRVIPNNWRQAQTARKLAPEIPN